MELWNIIEKAVTVPNNTVDVVCHVAYQKRNVRAKRVILDDVKDRLVPHIARKANDFEMCKSLTNLY